MIKSTIVYKKCIKNIIMHLLFLIFQFLFVQSMIYIPDVGILVVILPIIIILIISLYINLKEFFMIILIKDFELYDAYVFDYNVKIVSSGSRTGRSHKYALLCEFELNSTIITKESKYYFHNNRGIFINVKSPVFTMSVKKGNVGSSIMSIISHRSAGII